MPRHAWLPICAVTFLLTDIEESTHWSNNWRPIRHAPRRFPSLTAGGPGRGWPRVDARADEFFAAFQRAVMAIEAAIGIQRKVGDHACGDHGIRVRIGIHGRPTLTDNGYVGLSVHAVAPHRVQWRKGPDRHVAVCTDGRWGGRAGGRRVSSTWVSIGSAACPARIVVPGVPRRPSGRLPAATRARVDWNAAHRGSDPVAALAAVPRRSRRRRRDPDRHPTSIARALGPRRRISILAYGVRDDPVPEYWLMVGHEMASRFDGSRPQAVWIVSNFVTRGTVFTFPGVSDDPLIHFQSDDNNEAALDLFDGEGVDVWLQLEPGSAPMVDLIDIVLDRYGDHPSVIGLGVDVEWFQPRATRRASCDRCRGEGLGIGRPSARPRRAVPEALGDRWMPPTERDGIVSSTTQGHGSLDRWSRSSAHGAKRSRRPRSDTVG